MSYELKGADAFVSEMCTYGTSKLRVRGPKRKLQVPFLAVMGGTEVFGRFVERPFTQGLENRLRCSCVNMGSVNAGVDAFLYDTGLLDVARTAELTVVQALGAQNLSNRYYKVHPRRNDRFLRAHEPLVQLFPEIDFTDFHFNKHMLNSLAMLCAERFSSVRVELQETWISRMEQLSDALHRRVVLLWLRYRHGTPSTLGPSPALIEPWMIEAVLPRYLEVIEVAVETAEEAEDVTGMTFGPLELPAARRLLGPKEHDRIGDFLAEQLQSLMQ